MGAGAETRSLIPPRRSPWGVGGAMRDDVGAGRSPLPPLAARGRRPESEVVDVRSLVVRSMLDRGAA